MIVTVARLAVAPRPSSLTARRRPLDALAGTATTTVVAVRLDVLALTSSAAPLSPRKTILRTRFSERPRRRSRLPVWAESKPEQPAMQRTELIVAATEE